MKWDRETPCPSCPYRTDAPIALWSVEEFAKLLQNDRDEGGGPIYGCHEFRKRPRSQHRPCAGWLLDQKRRGVPSLALRFALWVNDGALALYERVRSEVPLYESIEKMCEVNLRAMTRGRKRVRK